MLLYCIKLYTPFAYKQFKENVVVRPELDQKYKLAWETF